jgi:HJR/Mrr/RecB family endonuclease
MSLFDWLRSKSSSTEARTVLTRTWTESGVAIHFAEALQDTSIESWLTATENAPRQEAYLAAYLSQLIVEGRCELTTSSLTLPWDVVYSLLAAPEHRASVEALALPDSLSVSPILECHGTLPDVDFELFVDGWVESGREVAVTRAVGAVVTVDNQERLLPEAAWRTCAAVAAFTRRETDKRTQHENELAWGRIRVNADQAGALYRTRYLESTIVLTPQALRLPLSREVTSFGRVITVEPTFAGAPDGWLKSFDGFNAVQPHYDIVPRTGGHVRVVISEPVRKVLSVIKREMPGRRVAGSRAERFIHNPWAFLGEAAQEVIREEEFAEDRAGAGSNSAAFSLKARYRDGSPGIDHVTLTVTEAFADGSFSTSTAQIATPDQLDRFAQVLEAAIAGECPKFSWDEYDLTLDGESTNQLAQAKAVGKLWRLQAEAAISYADIYELSGYSGRIEGIGTAKAIYVPLIQKPSADEEGKPGWLPSDLTPMVRVTLAGHDGQVVIPLSHEWVTDFEAAIERAEKAGETEIVNPTLPTPVKTEDARTLLEGFRAMLSAHTTIKIDGASPKKSDGVRRDTFIIKTNFHKVDYAEERRRSLTLPDEAEPRLPKSLRPNIKLKKHQKKGVAWFQHLIDCAPTDCRGALLADDMGLGKTLQLLVVLARYYEDSPDAPPSIIVAPKSLIPNWETETRKFFNPSFPEVLVLYGDGLKKRKQPLGLIDEQLQAKGFVDLLRPAWRGSAKIVITTYEVLTSYEFSFARQAFAFVICDEAQRIKTPGTQAAMSVRALKADFRVVCTGTPVENSLADLWCLFDFVQPGLLGGLEDFGNKYRRPIECDTEEQKTALQQLQDAIAPQILRRTKLELKDEFKKKYFAYRKATDNVLSFKEVLNVGEQFEVSMSAYQQTLYLGGLKKLQDANEETNGRQRARASFGALHLMKAVCAEPYCIPGRRFAVDKGGHNAHLNNSAKLAAVIEQLRVIQKAREKAILFTELREVQSCLFVFMRELFGLKPFIINGDSENRQTYIDKFSAAEGFDVIILSTLAAGAGLNVTAANHVFHFTRAWNPAKESQATDRAYRIGQERDVFVYCPTVVNADYATFDVRLDEMLRKKAELAGATLGDSPLEAMLNGTGKDIPFRDLVDSGPAGVRIEARDMTMDDVDRLDGFSFEVFCKILWSKSGYIAAMTPKRGGDGGIDVYAIKGRQGELLQCTSSGGSEVGWDAIKEVTAGAAQYQARFPGRQFRRVAVTNRRFTSGARDHAEANRVHLVERTQLEERLRQQPVTNHELEAGIEECLPLQNAEWVRQAS